MHILRGFICVLILLAGPLANAEDGWVKLFDGKTLNGWKKMGLGKAEYSVKEGAIHGVTVVGSKNTFLASEQQYGDFELQFEVRVHDELNSGVQIRSREKTAADVEKHGKELKRFFGPQVEIEAGPGESGYIYGESYGGGWRSKAAEGSKAPPSHNHMKNGEWNKFRIVAKGPRIQTWINGKQVEDLTDEEVFETHPKGHLGLQVHGIGKRKGPFDVSWRNIRIKELK